MIPRLFMHLAQIEDNRISIPRSDLTSSSVQDILKIVFSVFSAIAILIIVIAGMRYTISQGDPQATAKAKNTIIYAVIGLVISMAAFSIVTFVVSRI